MLQAVGYYYGDQITVILSLILLRDNNCFTQYRKVCVINWNTRQVYENL